MVEPTGHRSQYNTMLALCMLAKTTNTHSDYVVLLACRRQRWLLERSSILLFSYLACLVITETQFVYCAVGTDVLLVILIVKGLRLELDYDRRKRKDLADGSLTLKTLSALFA